MKHNLVFSGVQPTGNLHLGNYLGAIRNWVKIQHDHPSMFCIVDLHAITVPQDPKELRENTRRTAAAYIACGIDAKKNIIFNQSTVSGHSELAWILGTLTPLGWLNRMTQFKEKINKIHVNVATGKKAQAEAGIKEFLNEKGNLGLYAYPVLMAADILLYKATHIPVGEDQKQHLELARDIAGAFNRQFKQEYFTLPKPLIFSQAARVMSLNDGTRKMSKSEESDYSRVNLTDDADTIRKKFQKAKSDSTMGFELETLKDRPEAYNLLTIYATLSDITVEEAQQKFIDSGFGALKKELAELAVEKLSPITSEMNRLVKDTAYLDKILKDGAEKAAAIAEKNLKEIKEIVGFLIP